MKKSHRILISAAIALIIGWAMYLYYDYIQTKKEAIAEIKQLEIEAMAEITKPKGHIGLIGKNKKYVVVKISNDKNDLVYWHTFNPSDNYSVFATYDIGNITLELMQNEKIIYTKKITLNKGGDARFEIYGNKIKLQSKNL